MRAYWFMFFFGFTTAAQAASLAELGLEERWGLCFCLQAGPRWHPGLSEEDQRSLPTPTRPLDYFGEVGLALQSPYKIGLEAGLGAGSRTSEFFVGPLLRLPVVMDPKSRPWIHSLGLRAERFTAGGTDREGYGGARAVPSTGWGWSVSYGLEWFLGKHTSLGLRFGYQIAHLRQHYETYHYSNSFLGSGYAIDSQSSRDLDLSGPKLALTLGLWPKAPYLALLDLPPD